MEHTEKFGEHKNVSAHTLHGRGRGLELFFSHHYVLTVVLSLAFSATKTYDSGKYI